MDQLNALGRFTTQQAIPRGEQGLGFGLNLIETLRSLEQPGGLLQMQLQRAQALQDPTTRSAIAQSPFLAGQLGLGLRTGEGAQPQGGGPGQPILAANLPPLGAAQQASEALARAERGLILGQPERVAGRALGLPALRVEEALEMTPRLQQLQQAFGQGTRLSLDPQTGNVRVSVGGASSPLEFSSHERAAAAGSEAGLVPVGPTERGTFVLRKPPTTQQADPALLRDLGLIPPETPQGQPQGAPATPQGQPGPAPQQPVMLPPGVIPVPGSGAISAPAERTIGFPPPAPGARPIAPTPLVPPAPKRALSPLKPGQRVSAKIGGITVSQSGGPMSKEDFSQIANQRVLPLLQGAKNAIQILRNAGVLTDDLRGVALNGQRMNVVSRLAGVNLNDPGVVNSIVGSGLQDLVGLDPSVLQNPDVTAAAAFIARNLRSAVPLIARGFGEQRTNFREEQRLADALSFSGTSATGAEQIIDNYVQLFSTGQSPGLPGASLDNIIENWASDPNVLAPLSGATSAPQSSPTIHYRPEQ